MHISLSKLEQMIKSVVKEHTRKTKGGKVVQVRQHEDSRSKRKEPTSYKRGLIESEVKEVMRDLDKVTTLMFSPSPSKEKERVARSVSTRIRSALSGISPQAMARIVTVAKGKYGFNSKALNVLKELGPSDSKKPTNPKSSDKAPSISSGLSSIVNEVAKHDSFEAAYSAFKHRIGIPREVADEFQKKFGEGGKLDPKQAFRNLYEHATGGSGKKEIKKSAASSALYLIKSRVKGYTRRTKGGAVVNVKEHTDSRTKKEVKSYQVNPQIGKVKHSVSFHDGKQTHRDGSKFYGIKTFKNKKDLKAFVSALSKNGYKEE